MSLDTDTSLLTTSHSTHSNLQLAKQIAEITAPKKIFNLPLDEAKIYIYNIDFSMIINKMVNYDKWLRIEAEEACALYRNFLYLRKKYGIEYNLPPSEEVDEFWHQHILDTQQYHQDCDAIFGKYLHHYPYFGIDAHTTMQDLYLAFAETQKLHKLEFGVEIPAVTRSWILHGVHWCKKIVKRKFL